MEKLFYKAQTRYKFHAHIKIKIPVYFENQLFNELFAILDDVNSMYNSYVKDSYFDKINKQAGNFVEVDNETIQILEKVIHFSSFFEGKYDITIMPLLRLWGFYSEGKKRVPPQTDIDKLKQLVNYKNIEIDNNRVKIGKNQEIITGSFIKAYAVDKLVSKMRELGIDDAIVNAGGSTIAAINNENHPYWKVIVRNTEGNEELFTVKLSNQTYSTSQQSEYLTIGNKRYGHILNPITGYPSANKQTGIITDDCLTGDILSTALFNESHENFSDKIKKLKLEGFQIDEHDYITCTHEFFKMFTLKNEMV